jgi:hypothetical protein
MSPGNFAPATTPDRVFRGLKQPLLKPINITGQHLPAAQCRPFPVPLRGPAGNARAAPGVATTMDLGGKALWPKITDQGRTLPGPEG